MNIRVTNTCPMEAHRDAKAQSSLTDDQKIL